jgi:hypothetical protein
VSWQGSELPHACVQYPACHCLPEAAGCSGLHTPDLHSALRVQAAPMARVPATQAPVALSQPRLVPQLNPSRQSGRHAPTAFEQT